MFRKILCLLLCAVLTAALFTACGDDPASTDTGAGTDTAQVSSDPSADPTVSETAVFDENREHKFIVSDISKHSLVIFDLDYCDGDWKKLTEPGAAVWEWCADTDPNCKLAARVGAGIDEAKLRWSEYYQKEVIIACSSLGWAGIIDYQKKTVLWQAVPGENPHSVEMLPNGDLVVACAGDGATYGYLRYYPVSQGTTDSSGRIDLPSAHGVCWDPEQELLWALWADGICAVQINGYGTAKPTLVRISGMEAKFPSDAGGHDLSPVFGQPGKYWASAMKGLWIFDSEELTITKDYPRASVVGAANVKGNAYFEDNTFVQTVASGDTKNSTYEWSTRELRVITFGLTSGKNPELKTKTTKVRFDDREFYKAHALNIDYQ